MAANDEEVRAYLLLCNQGLEIPFKESVSSALDEAGYASSTVRPLFQHKYEEENLVHLRERVKNQLEKKRKRKESKQVKSFDIVNNNPIVGPLNDGSEMFLGEFRGSIVVAKSGATEVSLFLLHTVAPPEVICLIRSIGPMLALVTFKDKLFEQSCSSIDTITESILSLGSNESILSDYMSALRTWGLHARLWNNLYQTDLIDEDLLERQLLGENGLKFRASCLRNQKNKIKTIKSQDVYATIGSTIPIEQLKGSQIVPSGNAASNDYKNSCEKWKVDLKCYDFEVVGFILDDNFALGISLVPYNRLKSIDFSRGVLPSDITPPFIGKNYNQLVRLRPSTAALLLQIAQPEPGDILVDMCAGIGTIPVEAGLLNKGVVGLGGEVVSELGSLISDYSYKARSFFKKIKGSSDMILWDASLSALKDNCVDIIVCDMPFGQKCMSSNVLRQFTPLLACEMARIMRSGGRAILLGGSFSITTDALHSVGTNVFQIKSIFPVNIGGLLAYIIEVVRTDSTLYLQDNHRKSVEKFMSRQRKLLGQTELVCKNNRIQSRMQSS